MIELTARGHSSDTFSQTAATPSSSVSSSIYLQAGCIRHLPRLLLNTKTGRLPVTPNDGAYKFVSCSQSRDS